MVPRSVSTLLSICHNSSLLIQYRFTTQLQVDEDEKLQKAMCGVFAHFKNEDSTAPCPVRRCKNYWKQCQVTRGCVKARGRVRSGIWPHGRPLGLFPRLRSCRIAVMDLHPGINTKTSSSSAGYQRALRKFTWTVNSKVSGK